MSAVPPPDVAAAADRRRADRRAPERVADLSLPELRRILVTAVVGAAVLAAFLWMVRNVVVAGLMGALFAAYARPLYRRLSPPLPAAAGALVTLVIALAPVVVLLAYCWQEVVGVAAYVGAHQAEVLARVNDALLRWPVPGAGVLAAGARRLVTAVAAYGATLPALLSGDAGTLAVATTIFLFTAAYIFSDGDRVAAWTRRAIPPRYQELAVALEQNVRGVLRGVVYGTLLTQTLKSLVILAMNLAFGVPLAGVLAVLAFIIGFFPIVGSWSVYVPVAAWLLVFRDAPYRAGAMIVLGTMVNTVFISMFLRPKLAADRSRVLNFYWMLVGLVCGVYTFGLPGVVLGPVVIGLLKAVLDTVTSSAAWRAVDDADGGVAP